MKYEMGGVYTISVYGEVEANSEEEAKEKFSKTVEQSIGVNLDWIETVNCDAKLVYNYKFKVEKAIFNSGFNYQVKEAPIFINNINIDACHTLELYRAELTNGKYLFFLVRDKNNVYIPFNPTCTEIASVRNENYDFAKNALFNAMWFNGDRIYFIITEYGHFEQICIGNKLTLLGFRLLRIKDFLSEDERNNLKLSEYTSKKISLILTDDKKTTIEACYTNDSDSTPIELVRIENLI